MVQFLIILVPNETFTHAMPALPSQFHHRDAGPDKSGKMMRAGARIRWQKFGSSRQARAQPERYSLRATAVSLAMFCSRIRPRWRSRMPSLRQS
jgi:hypothetical protein